MKAKAKFQTWVIANDLAAARKIEPEVLAELRRHHYGDEAVFAIRLAIEEALANAINHGNGRDPAKSVRIEFAADAERVTIRVRDEGAGFDRGAVPDPTMPENLEKPTGRGIMLMEAYMTEVRWNRAGNCVEMVKERD